MRGLRSLLALATLALFGCAQMPSAGAPGAGLGDGRRAACEQVCPAGGACLPCDCDRLAGHPAICTPRAP